MQYPRVKLGNVCDILDYKRRPITKKDRIPGMIPYYGATGIVDYVKNYIFDEPLVLLGEDGAKWSGGDISAFEISGKTWVNNHAHVLRPHSELYSKWLVQYLNFADLSNYITGVTVPKLNQERMCMIELPLPPLPVQQEIIARLEKELGKVDEMANGFRRMAELAKEEFKAILSEAFEHVEGKNVKLGDICSKLSTGPFGSVLHKNDYVENGIPLVNPMHIIGDSIVPSHDMTVSVETAKRLDAYKLSRGDIVIGRRGEMGRAAVVTSKEEGWLCGTGSFFLHLKQQIEPEFFLLCFKSPKCIHQMVNTAKGATMQNLNHGLLKSLELILPSKETQLEIVKNIALAKERCEKLISYAQQSLSLCTELRKSILQEAFE